ncbi:unnamed protein product [Cochlearia groenlandica]
MQCSHLLSLGGDNDEVKKRLFDGSTFVPDVPSLQRWLEIAWSTSFDVSGSHHFGGRIHGSKRWIGTTECAALLQSFGLRATIVDFLPEKSKSTYLLLRLRRELTVRWIGTWLKKAEKLLAAVMQDVLIVLGFVRSGFDGLGLELFFG